MRRRVHRSDAFPGKQGLLAFARLAIDRGQAVSRDELAAMLCRRRDGPFVAVNCAALPENLLESEFFGYVGGAFTGASKTGKAGLFELAHRGTILLDEVSEIPLALQGRLLRVLQEREVMRLGDDRLIPVDVRVVAATNKDLKKLADSGLFRQDLLYPDAHHATHACVAVCARR